MSNALDKQLLKKIRLKNITSFVMDALDFPVKNLWTQWMQAVTA